MASKNPKLFYKELNDLDPKVSRDLNLLTSFFYDCISIKNGIVRKPKPRQMYDFIKKYRKEELAQKNKVRTPEPVAHCVE